MSTWVVSVCVSEEEHTLLAAAAELTGASVSEFIRRKALDAAETAILERRIITIAPDPRKTDKDIAIPVLSPVLTRKKSLAEEIAELDVSAFSCPVLPRKQDDAAAKTFRYEGYDIITLQKLIEREYSIPEPQTAEEVIGYYARRIAQDVKLPSQFSVLAPKVREFLETKAILGYNAVA